MGAAEIERALEVLDGALVLATLVEALAFLVSFLRRLVTQPPARGTSGHDDSHQHTYANATHTHIFSKDKGRVELATKTPSRAHSYLADTENAGAR